MPGLLREKKWYHVYVIQEQWQYNVRMIAKN